MTMTGRIPLSDAAIRAVDVAAFNDGVNPYGDTSIFSAIQCDSRRAIVRKAGFEGQGRVLDLLCGHGSWTIFLAELNGEVHGLDRNAGAIRIGQGLCRHFGFDNVHLKAGDVSETRGYPDDHFDAVWIWNALIYVDRGPTLSEVRRVLKPGGFVFVGAVNSSGRILEKLFQNLPVIGPLLGRKTPIPSERDQALKCLIRGTGFDGTPNYFTRSSAPRVFAKHGLTVTAIEEQGGRSYRYFPKNLNVTAVKPAGTTP